MWPEFLRVKGFYLRMQSLSFPCSLDSQYSAQIICSFHAHRWRSCYVVGTVTKGRRLRVRRRDFFTQGSGFATNSLINRNVPLIVPEQSFLLCVLCAFAKSSSCAGKFWILHHPAQPLGNLPSLFQPFDLSLL